MKSRDQSRIQALRSDALRWRQAGLSYRQVATQMGMSVSRVHTLVKEALEHVVHEGVVELRTIEASRLDQMQAAVWTRASRGDDQAINTVLRISQRRSRLLGLDIADNGVTIPEEQVETLARVYVDAAVDAAPYLGLARYMFALTSWARASAREELLGALLGTAPDAAQDSIGRQFAMAAKQASDGRESLGLTPTSAAQIATLVQQAGVSVLSPSEQKAIES